MGTCPDTIKRLIERFNQQSDQLRSPDYNETLIRIDYIIRQGYAGELPHRRERMEWEIDATDRRIDRLVYQLHGLTDAKVAVVEEATT